MTLTLAKAMQIFEEGKLACQNYVTLCPYEENTSEHFWWAKGWLEEHKSLWKRVKNARNKK